MIREFDLKDLEHFEPNSFSDLRKSGDTMELLTHEDCYKYTLIRDGIKAIIVFKDNGERDWMGFFLMSKGFTPRDGVSIKNFIDETVAKYKPKRLWTASQTSEMLTRWHRFLKMEPEDPINIKGKMYNVWSRTWA